VGCAGILHGRDAGSIPAGSVPRTGVEADGLLDR
jgi:hypothetical protein